MKRIVISLVGVFCLSGSLFSSIIRVPADQPTIQAGIDVAVNGDTVKVSAGTYTGVGNRDIDILAKSILLTSVSGRDTTIIDLQGSNSIGISIRGGQDSLMVVRGFTIRNANRTEMGSGMIISGSSPSIVDCRFENNVSFVGGGAIFVSGASNITIIDCVFSLNRTSGVERSNQDDSTHTGIWKNGGAIACVDNSSIALIGCDFDRNSAGFAGGAVFAEHSTLSFDKCTFTGNSNVFNGGAGIFTSDSSIIDVSNCQFIGNNSNNGEGGAMKCSDGVTLSCSNSLFRDNESINGGGAIRIQGSQMNASSCTFGNNRSMSAGGNGGAIKAEMHSRLVIDSCAFEGNLAGSGGGISIDNGSLTIGWSLFERNLALVGEPGSGGAILAHKTKLSISNSTLVSNAVFGSGMLGEGPFGGALFVNQSHFNMRNSIVAYNKGATSVYINSTSTFSLNCIDIYGNDLGDWDGIISRDSGLYGNISANPLFCDTANANYFIKDISPCAPSYNSCGTLFGAFDVDCTDFLCGDLTGDSKVTQDDLDFFISFYFDFGPPPVLDSAGDLNCTGSIDLADIVLLAQYLNSENPEICCLSGIPLPFVDWKKESEGQSVGSE